MQLQCFLEVEFIFTVNISFLCITYSGIYLLFTKMANHSNQLIKFRGNLKYNERNAIGVTPYVNVRTFLRVLRNYFTNNNITSDAVKLRILHNQIDPTIGDAIDLINCYTGEDVTYEQVEINMTKMYPELRKSNFKVSSQSISKFKLNDGQLFCSMTKLIQESKALAVAYLSNEERINFGLTEDTKFHIKLPGPADAAGNFPTSVEILCRDLLQNFIIHYFLASQMDNEIYDKVAGVTPAVNACEFMGKAVEHAEEIRMTKSNNNKKKEDIHEGPDVLFNVKENSRENKNYISKERTTRNCYNCGNTDHFRKDCPCCLYCKKKGHDAYKCYRRIDDNVPYCTYCKKVRHLAKDCQSRNKNITVKNPQNTKYQAKINHGYNSKVKKDKRERVRIVEDLENPDVQVDQCESVDNSDSEDEQA